MWFLRFQQHTLIFIVTVSLVAVGAYFLIGSRWLSQGQTFSGLRGVFSITNEDQQGRVDEKSKLTKATRVLLLYWSTYFGRRMRQVNNTKLNENCPIHCEWTSDRSRASEADGIIIHSRDPKPYPPWDKELANTTFILHSQENPVYTSTLKNAPFLSHFKYSFTYRLDSDFPTPSFSKPSLARPVPFKNKTGVVFAALSNCEPVRTAYLAKLVKLITVDSVGACVHNKDIPGLPKRYQTKDFREKKEEFARNYKFALVFMNADCDYFVDLQMQNALSAGSVPVYLGTDKVDEFLFGNLNSSIIKVRDFKSPEDLANYLKFLSNNETEYNKYLKWKYEGFQFPPSYYSSPIGKYWESPDPTGYCRICERLFRDKGLQKEAMKTDMCKGRSKERWLPAN